MRRLIPITGLDKATLDKDIRRTGEYLMAHMVHMDNKLYMERWGEFDGKYIRWDVIDDPSRLEEGAYKNAEEQVELLDWLAEQNDCMEYIVKVIPMALWNERLEQSKGGHNNG